jgi:hypothetical protein
MIISHKLYFLLVFISAFLVGSVIFSINYLIDPLWYFGGNKVHAKNFIFNERVSKGNLYLRDASKYNCVIFGSSRAIPLDAKSIEKFNCFNFAFSGANIKEIAHYARYVRRYSPNIKLVILGVDEINFVDRDLTSHVPDFIRLLGKPPSHYSTYTSLNIFRFSFSALFGVTRHRQYYGPDFTARILSGNNDFSPPVEISENYLNRYNIRSTDICGDQNIRYLKNLRKIFAGVEIWGYVPPVYADLPAYLRLSDKLDRCLMAIYESAQLFDRFYDFSVPSTTTGDPRNTYDGEHFLPTVQNMIGERFNGLPGRFGLDLHQLGFYQYQKTYERETDRYIAYTHKKVELSDCGAAC